MKYQLEEGIFKIGKTGDLESRIRSFWFCSPKSHVEYQTAYEINGLAETFEKELHEIFKDQRIRGEWFKLDNEDLEFIDSLCQKRNYRKEIRKVEAANNQNYYPQIKIKGIDKRFKYNQIK